MASVVSRDVGRAVELNRLAVRRRYPGVSAAEKLQNTGRIKVEKILRKIFLLCVLCALCGKECLKGPKCPERN